MKYGLLCFLASLTISRKSLIGSIGCLLQVDIEATIDPGIVRSGQMKTVFLGDKQIIFGEGEDQDINFIDYFGLPVYLSNHIKVFYTSNQPDPN
jgi:hypothetical protein